jgi:PAS domain S-box-containing protein
VPTGTKSRKSRPRLLVLALLGLFVAVGFTATGALANDSPWRVSADNVFKLVAANADLPHALIPMTMAESGSGFLWLGGDAGLERWDGYEFRDYPAQPTVPGGVHDSEIQILHRDANQQLWAGTKSAGLARYDPAQDRLVCLALVGTGCGSQHVWSIDDDGAGGLWVGTSTGLFQLDAFGRATGQWHHEPTQATGLPDDGVLAVLRDRHGVLWIGTSRGLARSFDSARTFSAIPLNAGAAPAVSRLMEDSAGRLWIGTRQGGAYLIGADRGLPRIIPETAPPGAADTATEITALLEIAPDRLWLGTYGRGIVEVDAATLRTRRILHDPFVPNGLDSDSVQSLYRDRSGIVWIGTEGGLSQYNPAAGAMTFFGDKGRRDGLPGDGVMAVLAAPDGSLWAGLQGDGFVVLDPAGRRATGLAGRRVFALAPAPAGGVLMGTDGGLFVADASGRSVVRLTVPGLSPTVEIHTLANEGGVVWLGPRDGGLWALQVGASGNVTVLRHETAPRLADSVVDVIATAPGGQLAVGTNSGFNLLDPQSGSTERILPDPADPGGFDNGLVVAFATDRRGRLWVGTSTGLDVLEGRDNRGRPRFRHLGVADGLPNESIDSLLVDRQGFVWASTDMGLAVIDPDDFKVRALQRADGLAITNYWAESAAAMPTGELVFGGIGGMTMVRPEAVKDLRYRPPVVITAARVGGKLVPVRETGGTLLVVPPDANNLAVEFAALDFSAPSRNRYSYRLDPFDAGWANTDAAHRVAAYTNLPPGKYVLRLRGSNRDGMWTSSETTMRIRVLPAWYQTFQFRLAAVIAAVFVLATLLRGWTAILRQRQRTLEREVADRTAELSVSKRQLQQANAALEMRVDERTQALAERTAALEASEARFRAWFNNAEDAVVVVQVEPDGRFVFEAVNAAVERMFGIAATAYPGREPEIVLPEEYAAGVLARYREAAQGMPIRFETRFASPKGERLLDTWIVPLRHPITARVERLVGATRDITERRELEARLAQAQKLQALGGLAGGIAHDFNNILQAVAGAATLIEEQPYDHDNVRRLAHSTIAAAERGTSITKRLLAFARSDELTGKAIPTAEVLEGLCEVLTHTLGNSIAVRASFATTLPPLLADRGPLETALVNLGTNARDAMPGGGVLTLSAESEQVMEGADHVAGLAPGRYMRIDVADTGCGMDAATMMRVVEPFFTTKPPGQGTGLGLGLVKGFAEQSGGGMAIESALGVGTTVSLWLPEATLDQMRRPPEPVADRASNAAPARILVVDDDDLVRETMAQQLEHSGFSVTAAGSGAEALGAIVANGPPDAMVCDLSMPGMNGIDTIKRARDLLPGLPCFLLTGYAGERAALESGTAFTLLRKPIAASVLVAQIDAGLVTGQR